ncbi:hypothetical protein AMAG_11460 [Allomyces macrogynus ATCC 38327]|uniref:Uncharacterized protein n=1 Tax=Allomyces macrogynus (strain ATCC 38327) TaxID=578462 RepID=A0A0L0SWS9_ALLM3|nr:hypothetical protein AMAG_11460 [Allomyces macrogynus ATCC 38327]|eukprot:KNE66993.1 hypothetical protein AMAG_11460 [Allomyces macrogynus ATCC 38327]
MMGQLLLSAATFVVDAGHARPRDAPPSSSPGPGHIAAIVGVLVALLALKAYYTLKRRRQRQQRPPPPDTSTLPRTTAPVKDSPIPPTSSGSAASRAGSALSPDTESMRLPVSSWLFRYNDYTAAPRPPTTTRAAPLIRIFAGPLRGDPDRSAPRLPRPAYAAVPSPIAADALDPRDLREVAATRSGKRDKSGEKCGQVGPRRDGKLLTAKADGSGSGSDGGSDDAESESDDGDDDEGGTMLHGT